MSYELRVTSLRMAGEASTPAAGPKGTGYVNSRPLKGALIGDTYSFRRLFLNPIYGVAASVAGAFRPGVERGKLPLFIFLLFTVYCSLFTPAFAQKFGYVDTKAILEKMPEYKQSQAEVTKQTQVWQQEIEAKMTDVDKLRKEYLAEEILLTDEMKQERLTVIDKKDRAAKDQQKKVFGFEGLYFLKKQELIKPAQDKVFDAVEKVCKKKKVQIMFDKSADLVMIYTDPKHDYTDFVLEELGLGDKNDTVDNKKKEGGAEGPAGGASSAKPKSK